MVIPTLLLAVGVVYCQMHYGVDALGGLAVGLLVTWLVNHKSVSGEEKA
jgi:membrane-associated phospholipid phosphatase